MSSGTDSRGLPAGDFKQGVEMIYVSFRPVIAEVDEVKLSLAITNLIENAIKYNVPDGWVRVSLNADHKYFYIKVADSGIGIPEEAQDLIFERFDQGGQPESRSPATGLDWPLPRVLSRCIGAPSSLQRRGKEHIQCQDP